MENNTNKNELGCLAWICALIPGWNLFALMWLSLRTNRIFSFFMAIAYAVCSFALIESAGALWIVTIFHYAILAGAFSGAQPKPEEKKAEVRITPKPQEKPRPVVEQKRPAPQPKPAPQEKSRPVEMSRKDAQKYGQQERSRYDDLQKKNSL